MSWGFAVQTRRYGAINMFELTYDGHPVASLVQEDKSVVDYSRRRVFCDLDTAIEFYRTQIATTTDSGLLTVGYTSARNSFVVHDSCFSFPL